MRIAFFDFINHFGGASQLAADTATRLSAEHDVQVIDAYGVCGEYLDALRRAGIVTHVLAPEEQNVHGIGARGRKWKRLLRAARLAPRYVALRGRLRRALRDIEPDVVWTNSYPGLTFLGLTAPLRRIGVALYVCGCPDAASFRGRDKWIMKHRTSMLMAISTETARQLRLAGMPDERIRIVFDTIDFEDTLRRSQEPLHGPLPGEDRSPRILVPASLMRTKGHHAAIRAVGRLRAGGLEPALWIAGDTIGHEWSYEAWLKQLVQELDLTDSVHFLGWRRDVPAIISRADVVALPTHTEGFGHVILEAMLLRRPVVATHVGGTKDSIEDGINGLVFPVDDDAAMAAQLERLVRDPELAARLVENGYKTVTERFNPELHTRRVADALGDATRSLRR